MGCKVRSSSWSLLCLEIEVRYRVELAIRTESKSVCSIDLQITVDGQRKCPGLITVAQGTEDEETALCSHKSCAGRRIKYKFAVRHSEIGREIAVEIDQSKAGETQGFRVENPTNQRSCRSTHAS